MFTKVLLTAFIFLVIVAVPQIIDDAINLLPQPIPQIIGVLMLAGIVTIFIAVINKLLKGTN